MALAYEPVLQVENLMELVSAEIEVTGVDHFGCVREGASLHVRGRTKTGFLDTGFDDYIYGSAAVVIRSWDTHDRSTTLSVALDDPRFHHAFLNGEDWTQDTWSYQYGMPVLTLNLFNAEVRGSSDSKFGYSYGLVLVKDAHVKAFRRIGLLDCKSMQRPKQTSIEKWFADADWQDLTLI